MKFGQGYLSSQFYIEDLHKINIPHFGQTIYYSLCYNTKTSKITFPHPKLKEYKERYDDFKIRLEQLGFIVLF